MFNNAISNVLQVFLHQSGWTLKVQSFRNLVNISPIWNPPSVNISLMKISSKSSSQLNQKKTSRRIPVSLTFSSNCFSLKATMAMVGTPRVAIARLIWSRS